MLRGSLMARSLLIQDAAAVLGVCRRTVYYWIHDGKLRTVKTRGGTRRVTTESIAEVLRARRVKSRAAAVSGTGLFEIFRAL
jgi:excisionase family DNA binding protein